ncbi:hypothetical protein ACP6L2_11630 [Sphingobacterium lactis]
MSARYKNGLKDLLDREKEEDWWIAGDACIAPTNIRENIGN